MTKILMVFVILIIAMLFLGLCVLVIDYIIDTISDWIERWKDWKEEREEDKSEKWD